MNEYTAYAINDQGCRVEVGIDWNHINGGRSFATISEAESAARGELISGWKVIVEDETGAPVKEFHIH